MLPMTWVLTSRKLSQLLCIGREGCRNHNSLEKLCLLILSSWSHMITLMLSRVTHVWQGFLFPLSNSFNMPFSDRYRTQFRPMYKIAFKIVTRLEWKCCPGYQGQDCRDVKPTLNHQTVPRGSQPFYSPNPGHTTRHAQSKKKDIVKCWLIATYFLSVAICWTYRNKDDVERYLITISRRNFT